MLYKIALQSVRCPARHFTNSQKCQPTNVLKEEIWIDPLKKMGDNSACELGD